MSHKNPPSPVTDFMVKLDAFLPQDYLLLMKKFIMTLLSLLLITPLGAETPEHAAESKRSVSLNMGGVFVYKDSFGGLSPGLSAGFSYNYHLSDRYYLGINLARVQYHPGEEASLASFAYGFTFVHLWPTSWGDLGPWRPYTTYSILLNQAFIPTEGEWAWEQKSLGHNTRMALGTEFSLHPALSLTWEGVWNYTSFAFFDGQSAGYQSWGVNLGTRINL